MGKRGELYLPEFKEEAVRLVRSSDEKHPVAKIARDLDVSAETGETDPDWQQDSLPPTVTKASPTGKKVSLKANATATFSEAMDPATLDGTTFKLVKKGSTKPLAATVTYSASTAKATLNPVKNLKSGAAYKATVTAGATDTAGNALVAKTWGFKVR